MQTMKTWQDYTGSAGTAGSRPGIGRAAARAASAPAPRWPTGSYWVHPMKYLFLLGWMVFNTSLSYGVNEYDALAQVVSGGWLQGE